MIQPTNPITIPAATADGLWITNLIINAPSATQPIRVVATVAPFVSADGTILKSQAKVLQIPDLYAAAGTDPNVATGIQALFAAIQSQVQSQGLF